ncbi:NAD(P)H-dependent glycerol-3-phosphate dehydrogenase [Chthonobacter rhizosphaerae]|uniref:NAD(P)H-dependent glycerol-3-phosphate dehydrogenase n=1 Tax=Chthonobacter rhizosphaerae TaxID=2735553 RepID=UPI0015EEE20D|nr:NAD(P)H-dependent glycerol-3-phosphate dehydrogenase [Chthonobacter rhizosphaerae]
MTTIGIFGAGAWGSALAQVAARAGHDALIVGRDPEVIEAINARHETPALPGVPLDPRVRASADLAALEGAEVVLCCVPAQATHVVVAPLSAVLKPGTAVISCAKGIDRATGLLVSEVIAATWLRGPVGVLSGPGFAMEVAAGLPTAVSVAADDRLTAEALARVLAAPGFRPYATGDLTGVQLGGALKNVFAIAAGVVAGRRLGASAEAAVITRGFVEMRRLAAAWGAKAETLMGLSGLGDLVLTCRSVQSRNFAFGLAIGEGRDPHAFGKLAEGAFTAGIALERATALGIEAPILQAVADVIEGRIGVDGAVDRLLSRPLKREDVI